MNINININIDDRYANFVKGLLKSRRFRNQLLTAVIGIPFALYAAPVTIPNTFSANTVASAAQVNANFSALATAVNANRVVYAYNFGCGAGCPSTIEGSVATITVNSITIATNGAGVVTVGFNGSAECFKNTATVIDIFGQITDTSGATAFGYGDGGAQIRMPFTATGSFPHTFSMNSQRTFSVAGPGTYTYYYRANNWNGGASPAGCTFFGGNMTAIFIPTP